MRIQTMQVEASDRIRTDDLLFTRQLRYHCATEARQTPGQTV
jgi:hypothetical protein